MVKTAAKSFVILVTVGASARVRSFQKFDGNTLLGFSFASQKFKILDRTIRVHPIPIAIAIALPSLFEKKTFLLEVILILIDL